MVNGYWYVVAVSALTALLAAHTSFPGLLFVSLGWVCLLYRRKRIGAAALLLSFLAASYFTFLPPPSLLSPSFTQTEEEVSVSGKIKSSISQSSSKIEFTFAVSSPEPASILVVYFSEQQTGIPPDWKRGAVCRITGKAGLPSSSTNPGQFNFRQYLFQQGITHQIILENLNKVQCTGKSAVSYMDQFRQAAMIKAETGLKPETASWIGALLFGKRDGIPDDVIEVFQEWGLSHLLAISGLHVGLLSGIAYFFLIKGNLITREKAVNLLIVALPLYIIVAGESPSVWRACLMGTVALSLAKWKVKLTVIDIISIIFLFSAMADPFSVYQLSFQFSFLVTFALLLSRNLLKEIHHVVFLSLTVSLISQLVILPLQVDSFFFVNPLSPFANLLFVPYFSLFVVPAALLLFLSLFAAPFLLPVAEFVFLTVHSKALAFLGSLEEFYVPWVIGSVPDVVYFGYFSLFIVFMAKWTAGDLKTSMKYACFMILLFLAVSIKPYVSEQGTVTALDIGQGDSMVIELPRRKGVIVVDTGGMMNSDFSSVSDSSYQQILKPFLYSKGIVSLDAVFLTHPDLDHVGNFPFLNEDFTVEHVLVNEWFASEASKDTVIKLSDLQTFEVVKAPYQYQIQGQLFQVLSPEADLGSSNENSLVLLTELGGLKWLFTGDMEEKAEREFTKKYPGLDIDVLKIAHHGSKTSSGDIFLDRLSPETAIISVGRNNRFGHPADETIEKLKGLNAEIYRTDRDGAVKFSFTENVNGFTPFRTR